MNTSMKGRFEETRNGVFYKTTSFINYRDCITKMLFTVKIRQS
jgi:hypothetical protein